MLDLHRIKFLQQKDHLSFLLQEFPQLPILEMAWTKETNTRILSRMEQNSIAVYIC